jgi:DnaD/phage-associated family protein
MGYLLTKPDNWTVRIDDLVKQGPAKLTKLRRMLSEARLYGYMNRIRISRPDGTFDWITEVFESPSQNPHPSTSVRFSTSGLPTSGKPADIANTESISTELNVNERTATLAKLYSANIGVLTPILSDKIKTAAETFTDATWYEPAFEVAVFNNARNWNYVETVLTNWKDKGRGWKPTPMKTNSRAKVAVPMQFDAQGNVIG